MKKIILTLLLLLTACSKPLYEGTVIEKHFSKEHKLYQPIIINVNKQIQIIPRWITISDHWYIEIQNGDKKGFWDVSEDYYNSVEVGDYVTSEQLQEYEETLRKWIKDWEECIDIYQKYHDSNNQIEQVLAERAKEQANKIADDYNKLIHKYETMYNGHLPDGIYAAIERFE